MAYVVYIDKVNKEEVEGEVEKELYYLTGV